MDYLPGARNTTDDSNLDNFCLVFGKPLLDTTLHCSLKGCNFGAHTMSIDILVDLNQLNFEPDSFCCNSLLQNRDHLDLNLLGIFFPSFLVDLN